MRKIFTLFALVTMTINANALQYYDTSSKLNYELDETAKTAIIVNHSSYAELVGPTIPQKIKYNNEDYSVIAIGDAAFKNCTSLEEIDNSFTLDYIGEEAFAGCSSLVVCALTAREIKKKAFVGCTSFNEDAAPYRVEIVGDSAFAGCSTLDIHWFFASNRETLNSVGANAFEGCGFNSTFTLQLGYYKVKQLHIGENAFKNCNGIKTIVISSNITFDGNVSPFDGMKDQLDEVRLSDSLTTISAKLFAGMSNTSITTVAAIGDGIGVALNKLQTIGDSAFAGCAALNNVSINNLFGSSLTTIGADAFNGCSAVTAFALPASLATIGDRAFAGMSNLAQITANMTTPPAINANVFDNCGTLSSIKLKVSDADYNTYKAANVWKELKVLRLSGLWSIYFGGHDINKATVKVLNAANDEELDETQIANGTTVKFEVTTENGYLCRTVPEPMQITEDAYINIDIYAVTYRQNYRLSGSGHGTIEFQKNGVDLPLDLINGYYYLVFEYGTQLQLTAVPAPGYRFVQWSNGLTQPQRTLTYTTVPTSIQDGNFRPSDYTYQHRLSDITALFEEDPATGVDNIAAEGKAVKRIVNGQMVIEKNGKLYNALGAEVR